MFATEKKGYSGVAVFTKEEPDFSELGMSVDKFDKEGRIIRVDYSDVTLVNVYVPSGTMGGVRQDYKMDFLKYFKIYINRLKSERPNIIVTGDYNICHKAIDINHPERHKKSSGFLPEEKQWVDNFIRDGFIDSFREYNKEPNNYSWWSYRAGSRQKNLGWRIDYFMVSNPLLKRLNNAKILKDVIHSDHCPVMIEIEI